jgi:hypothetical protein
MRTMRKLPSLAIMFSVVSALTAGNLSGQKLHLGLFMDPLIGWYASDNNDVTSEGSKAGFAAGVTANYFFSTNYAFSGGFTYLRTGGVQSHAEDMTMLFSNYTVIVPSGDKVSYSADYFLFPIGLKLRSNQIGYFTIVSDFGVDPGFLNKGKISIPSLSIEDESAAKELAGGIIGFHFQIGAEYSLGGTTAINVGLGYEGSFSDVTVDNAGQPADKTKNRIIRLHLGLYF